MEWKYFFVTAAYILTVCGPVLGANTIINVTLMDGETPNEGRVEILISDAFTWTSACGDGLGSQEVSVICRQLGYPGVNNFFGQWPFRTGTSISQQRLRCDGDEENLADCSLFSLAFCSNAGGVICYESGYIGCYPASAVEELQTPCEYGLNDIQNLTIPNCVSLCNRTNDIYTYAGLYSGSMCLCGNPSATINQSDRVADRLCSSPCAGRNIESCGGSSYIALFNTSGTPEPMTAGTGTAGTTSVTETPTSQGLTTTVHAVSESNNPAQSTIELVTTNINFTSSGTSPQPEKCTCPPKPECSSSKGVQIGLIAVVVALLLYAVAITFLLIQLRRKVPTRTKENGPDPYMDLQPRPEADGTYQEMAITSTASSPKPGESHLPSSNLFYENQNVAQYANKIKEGADYEDVLTPN